MRSVRRSAHLKVNSLSLRAGAGEGKPPLSTLGFDITAGFLATLRLVLVAGFVVFPLMALTQILMALALQNPSGRSMTSRCRRLATIRVMLRRPAGLPGTNSAQCYYRATIPNASRQCMKALGRELLALQKIYVDRFDAEMTSAIFVPGIQICSFGSSTLRTDGSVISGGPRRASPHGEARPWPSSWSCS